MSEFDVESIVSQMTLEEKAKLLVGIGMPGLFGNPHSRVHGAAGATHAIERLGIPSVVMADGPAGVRISPVREGDARTYHATAFPVAVMLASTWNLELVERVGRAIGEEAREYGVDVLLAPGVNIHRHPLCGRNFEYFSEDPLLSGLFAAAYVRGVQSAGVGATPKHFAANEQETNRFFIDTIVSERALREIYLKPFEIVVKEAKPWAVMSAYNKLNGKYCSQSEWLLTKVLREEWGFNGIVMTDWFAGDNPVEQVKAGNDLIMPGKAYQINPNRKDEVEELVNAVKRGELDERVLDASVKRVLKFLAKTPALRGYRYSNQPDLEAHAGLAYEAASEGVVLLKNNGALPLKEGTRVAVFGTGQIETVRGGTGSGWTYPRYVVSILEGLRESGLKVDGELAEMYQKYVQEMRKLDAYKPKEFFGQPIKPRLPEDFLDTEMVNKVAERNDAAIIVIARVSGEGADRLPTEGDFYLASDERALLKKVCAAFHALGKNVIMILNIGAPIEVASWRDDVNAILLVWQAGQETGRIAADALVGRINPSGKLPTTFPRDWPDVPVAKSFECYPGVPPENPRVVRYCEGVYVGYRYYDTYGVEPAYEFGFGLSYTKFEYGNLTVEKVGDKVRVSFEVVNVGGYPGKEVAQVYVKAPRGKLDKPFQELKAFKKTKLLKPGESEKIILEIDVKDLASFDESEKVWLVEKGTYEVRVGASSRNIKLTGTFTIENDIKFKP
jgi:beta-glucosidase